MENEKFEYSYSADKQEEIEKLKEKYTFSQDDRLDKMKALDAATEKSARKVPVIMGSCGLVLLAFGMCASLALDIKALFIAGIAVGVIGIALMAAALPLYNKRIVEERKRVSPEMLRLADGTEG